MLDILKKFGIPATIAAIISAFVTIIPFLFKIDERYAKEDEVKAQFEAVDKQIAGLTIEAGKMAGTQQVLVAVISANSMAATPVVKSVQAPAPEVQKETPISIVPPKSVAEKVERLEQVSRQLQTTQRNLSAVSEIKPEKMVGEARELKK